MESRKGVAEADIWANRRPIGVAIDGSEAARRLADARIPGETAFRPRLPVPRDPREDDVIGQIVGPKAPGLHDAGPEVFQNHVDRAALGHPADDVSTGIRPQVCRHALAIPAIRPPPKRCSRGVEIAKVPERVSLLRRLDLDHAGPKVSEQGRAHVPGHDLAEVENHVAFQRPRSLRHISSWTPRRAPERPAPPTPSREMSASRRECNRLHGSIDRAMHLKCDDTVCVPFPP